MTAIFRPGEHIPFEFEKDGADGYTCTIKLKQYPDGAALVDREVALTNGKWQGYLTATETTALEAGKQYSLTATLSNTSLDKSEEIVRRFYIGHTWG